MEIRTEYLPTKFEIKKGDSGRYVIIESWDHWLASTFGAGYTRITAELPGDYRFKWQARRAVRYFRRTGNAPL